MSHAEVGRRSGGKTLRVKGTASAESTQWSPQDVVQEGQGWTDEQGGEE